MIRVKLFDPGTRGSRATRAFISSSTSIRTASPSAGAGTSSVTLAASCRSFPTIGELSVRFGAVTIAATDWKLLGTLNSSGGTTLTTAAPVVRGSRAVVCVDSFGANCTGLVITRATAGSLLTTETLTAGLPGRSPWQKPSVKFRVTGSSGAASTDNGVGPERVVVP